MLAPSFVAVILISAAPACSPSSTPNPVVESWVQLPEITRVFFSLRGGPLHLNMP